MPGNFILRPIEANLTRDTEFVGTMSPYCSVAVGDTKAKGEICKKGGKHPHWSDSIIIPIANESKALVELMDKDAIIDDNIGSFTVDLKEVQSSGHVKKWYPLTYNDKSAGEMLIEISCEPEGLKSTSSAGITGIGKNQYFEQEEVLMEQPGVPKKEEIVTTTQPVGGIFEKGFASAESPRRSNVWTEQKQVIKSHTFVKEVEVVETRPALREIEVMEPVKVMKEVHYTQAVPVKKQIEVCEPQVVIKEIEVIEPRLISKTIQVVENVPVKRQVEVIEMRSSIKEVESLEPHTFTKQVEVTEFVPVRKQVEVTQPVTLKKAVEFVEPVITTQIITKELQEPVIVNEEMITSVGPASIVGISREYGYVKGFGEMTISEQQRLAASQRWIGCEKIFEGLNEMERFFEQQRLSRLSEQEWTIERKRLLAMNSKDRLIEQRRVFALSQKTTTVGPASVTGLEYAEGIGGMPIFDQQIMNANPRWIGYELIFDGLNENERFFEQQRLSKLSEQEWMSERKRLLAMSPKDRLVEQRRLLGLAQKTGGYSSYIPMTESIERTAVSGGVDPKIESKARYARPTAYRPSPNF